MRLLRLPHRLWLCAYLGFCGAFVLASHSASAAKVSFTPQERAVSASGQFFVYSKNAEARSVMASTAQELHRGVTRMLGMPRDRFSHPVVITLSERSHLHPNQPEAYLNLYNTDGGMKVQLDFALDLQDGKIDLAVELVRAILLEIAAADLEELPDNTPYALPPDWLAYGVVEWVRVELNGNPAPVFSGMLEARMPFYELLSKRYLSLDTTSQKLYRAYAYCLVHLLTDQPQGSARFRHLVRNAPAHPLGGLEVLGKFFPDLTASGDSLDKWWLLSVANLANEVESGSLNVPQTEGRLTQLLEIPVVVKGENKEMGLTDFKELVKLPNREEILAPVKGRLLKLSSSASPMYAPVLSGYDTIITNLMAGRTKQIEMELAKLAMLRKLILERNEQIEDFLNWYEATQLSQRSEAFDGFIETSRGGPHQTSPIVKDDSISLYLDAIEREMQ